MFLVIFLWENTFALDNLGGIPVRVPVDQYFFWKPPHHAVLAHRSSGTRWTSFQGECQQPTPMRRLEPCTSGQACWGIPDQTVMMRWLMWMESATKLIQINDIRNREAVCWQQNFDSLRSSSVIDYDHPLGRPRTYPETFLDLSARSLLHIFILCSYSNYNYIYIYIGWDPIH